MYIHPDGYYQIATGDHWQDVSDTGPLQMLWKGMNERNYLIGNPMYAYAGEVISPAENLEEARIYSGANLQKVAFWNKLFEGEFLKDYSNLITMPGFSFPFNEYIRPVVPPNFIINNNGVNTYENDSFNLNSYRATNDDNKLNYFDAMKQNVFSGNKIDLQLINKLFKLYNYVRVYDVFPAYSMAGNAVFIGYVGGLLERHITCNDAFSWWYDNWQNRWGERNVDILGPSLRVGIEVAFRPPDYDPPIDGSGYVRGAGIRQIGSFNSSYTGRLRTLNRITNLTKIECVCAPFYLAETPRIRGDGQIIYSDLYAWEPFSNYTNYDQKYIVYKTITNPIANQIISGNPYEFWQNKYNIRLPSYENRASDFYSRDWCSENYGIDVSVSEVFNLFYCKYADIPPIT